MRIILLLLGASLTLTACRKEKIITKEVEVPVKHSWTELSTLTGNDRLILNSVALNDSIIYFFNSYGIYPYNARTLARLTGFMIPYGLGYPLDALQKPSISPQIGVAVATDAIRIYAMANPVNDPYGSMVYRPVYSSRGPDSSQKGFARPYGPQSGYPILNNKYVLTPVEISYPAEEMTFDMIGFDLSASIIPTQLSVLPGNVKHLTLTPPNPRMMSGSIYYSSAYYDKFFVYWGNQAFSIDTTGKVKKFGYGLVPGLANQGGIAQMFTLSNNLFAMGILGKMFVSSDKGDNWTLYQDLGGTSFGVLQYVNVGEEVYAFFKGQVARITLNGTVLSATELDNDGFENTQITSITHCGKYAFITTLSGVFYREWDKFNTPKATK